MWIFVYRKCDLSLIIKDIGFNFYDYISVLVVIKKLGDFFGLYFMVLFMNLLIWYWYGLNCMKYCWFILMNKNIFCIWIIKWE